MAVKPILSLRNKNRKLRLGWIPDLPDHRDIMYAEHMQQMEHQASLPTVVDLSKECPPVYDQKQLGSCTANAIAGAFEFDQLGQKIDAWTPSRLFIYYNERVIEGTVNTDSGAQLRDGIKVIAKLGVPPEKQWPYVIKKFATKPPAKVFKQAKKNEAISYFRLDNIHIEQLRTCLAAGFPFIFGFTVYESFMKVGPRGIVPLPKFGEQVEGGHAVMAVGYDDEKSYFKFRNSWGEKWGSKGYGYMPYAYLTNPNLAADFWTIRSVT